MNICVNSDRHVFTDLASAAKKGSSTPYCPRACLGRSWSAGMLSGRGGGERRFVKDL